MLTLRRCVVGVVAVLLVGGLASAQTPTSSPCPSGQELREARYDTTSIQSRGCVGPDSEDNYRRQGHWEFFHPNGQKSGEGSYVDGNQGGETDLMGILIDGREGAWMFWYENGQKRWELTYRDGEREGLYTLWYENGQKIVELTYRDGEGEGLATEWHANGQKEAEGTLRDGEQEGLWTWWHENGQKR
ncbi:uncharacterized protein METZ01_LOCUS276964, partial [marine metagenome]